MQAELIGRAVREAVALWLLFAPAVHVIAYGVLTWELDTMSRRCAVGIAAFAAGTLAASSVSRDPIDPGVLLTAMLVVNGAAFWRAADARRRDRPRAGGCLVGLAFAVLCGLWLSRPQVY